MPIFTTSLDYKRFLKTMLYYQKSGAKPKLSLATPKTPLPQGGNLIDMVCYCLMPNHFHFIVKQRKENGISHFISQLTNSYTRYFNIKNKRVGPLFQGVFKSVHIQTDYQLMHVSRYIHLNPVVGYVTKNLEHYKWSSYFEYTRVLLTDECEKTAILNQFPSRKAYMQFVLDQEEYGRKLETVKHQLLDLDNE